MFLLDFKYTSVLILVLRAHHEWCERGRMPTGSESILWCKLEVVGGK